MKLRKCYKFVLIFLISLFVLKSNVYADVQCDALPNVAIDDSIPNLVSLIIKAIQIIVPILLVVFGSFDLVKGITSQKDDEIKKGQQIFIKRLIAGVLVFFVIAIVKMLISAVSGDNSSNIINCACYFFNGANSKDCGGSGSNSGGGLDSKSNSNKDSNSNPNKPSNKKTNIVYVGDNRLRIACKSSTELSTCMDGRLISKAGAKHDYVDTAISTIKNLAEDAPNDKWILVLNLGYNDLVNSGTSNKNNIAASYVHAITNKLLGGEGINAEDKKLLEKSEIYYVPVLDINETILHQQAVRITQKDIDNFNNRVNEILKEMKKKNSKFNNVHYCTNFKTDLELGNTGIFLSDKGFKNFQSEVKKCIN